MAKYFYPNAATLTEIAAELILDYNRQNPIFQYVFPIMQRNAINLQWFVNGQDQGLMKLRGAGGPPTPITEQGKEFFETTPGVFGEYSALDEIELLELGRGVPRGNTAIAVSVEDRILQKQATLNVRYYNRLRQMAWSLATTGTLAIALPGGGIGYQEAITVRTRTVSPLWTDYANATPLLDLQTQQTTYGFGSSNNFGYGSTVMMNSLTFGHLLRNTNAADFGGIKVANQNSARTMGDYEDLRLGWNLPQVLLWDDGYINEAGTFTLDIPTGTIIQVGARPNGERPGEFALTYNAVHEGTGPYSFVFDKTVRGNQDQEIPPRLEVHMGFNGGLVAHRPTQILKLIVSA
jgi:hypothetical protein